MICVLYDDGGAALIETHGEIEQRNGGGCGKRRFRRATRHRLGGRRSGSLNANLICQEGL
jgi:hypothetical protein